MKKFHLVLIFVLGIFFMPYEAFACSKDNPKTEKSCCDKKETDTKSEKKSCCDNNNSEKGCGGKCGNSNCTSTSTVHFSVVTFNDIEIKNNIYVISDKKQNFFHNEANISSGFHSLWLIPKIS